MKKIISLFALLAVSLSAAAEIHVDNYFQDNMLIQQGKPVVVWGKGTQSVTVSVTLCGDKQSTQVNNKGEWQVSLAAQQASNNACKLTVNGKVFNNVVIGELWLAAGQSNMVRQLRLSDSYPDFIDDNDELLRLFRHQMQPPLVKVYTENDYAQSNVDDFFSAQWQQSITDNKAEFSAVGWHFGRKLREQLNIPVGVIQLAVGGSTMAEWIRLSTLKSHAVTAQLVREWPEGIMVSPGNSRRFKKSFQTKLADGQYQPYVSEFRHMTEPSFLFDAGVNALSKVAFRGVVWYQGESNAYRPADFNLLLPMLVNDWRNFFKQGDFPFYYVQLPSFKKANWPIVREIQRKLLTKIDNTAMAVTIDLGAENNIHPTDKKLVGVRLAALALNKDYGHKEYSQSPMISSHRYSKTGLVLTYQHQADGLISSQALIKGFEAAGSDGVFKAYPAEISASDQVSIIGLPSSTKIIRYAFTPFAKPLLSLTNSDGQPAMPFELLL